MIKNIIFKAASSCVKAPGISKIFAPFYRGLTNIIYYHGVWKPTVPEKKLFGGLSIDTFVSDMKTICKYFRPVSLDEAIRINNSDEHINRPTVTVSFDDGCDLVRSGAVDVLNDMNISATNFVTLACVGNHHLMWQHKFSSIRVLRGDEVFLAKFNELADKIGPGSRIYYPEEQTLRTRNWPMGKKDEYVDSLWEACEMPPLDEFLEQYKPYVDWPDLKDWVRSGHQVGLHTLTHPFCSQLKTVGEIEAEIVKPAHMLRDQLNLKTLPFAYPFGDRLVSAREDELSDMNLFSCMLGIQGLSHRGTPYNKLDRASGEAGLDKSVFSRPLLKALKGQ